MGPTLRGRVLHVGDGSNDSANVEARETLGLLVLDVHALDLGAPRSLLGERHHPVDGLGLSLEHRLHGAVGAVGDPARDATRARFLLGRVAVEDALHVPVDYHSLAHAHARVLPRRQASKRLRGRAKRTWSVWSLTIDLQTDQVGRRAGLGRPAAVRGAGGRPAGRVGAAGGGSGRPRAAGGPPPTPPAPRPTPAGHKRWWPPASPWSWPGRR